MIELSEKFKKHFKDRFEFKHKKFSEIKIQIQKKLKELFLI